jgi:hypothetical protein
MKNLIIFIVSGILLLSSGARAEEVYLNCKFVRGDFTLLEPYFSSENMNKNSEYANDIGISLDLKNKKILYLTDAYFLNNSTEYLQSRIRIIDWYEKNITFIYYLDDNNNINYIYNLDRLSGNLKRTIDMITESKKKIKASSYSECSKQNKKF